MVSIHIKYNIVFPTSPARNTFPSVNVLIHMPFDHDAAELVVEFVPETVEEALGKNGFVIVKAAEIVVLCALVGVASPAWLESVIPDNKEEKFAGESVACIAI